MARRRRGEPESVEGLMSEGAEFIRRFESGEAHQRDALAAAGVALAYRLRSGAIGLSLDKATEFSPAIPRLHLLAAQVAFLAFGPATTSSGTDGARVEKVEQFEKGAQFKEGAQFEKRARVERFEKDLTLFERDVFYYESFTPEHSIVAEYREFKARHSAR